MIRDMLEQRKDLQENLFIRGFFISDKLPERLEEFPFYGNWKTQRHGGYYFLTHKKQNLFTARRGDDIFFLAGHAYNPFTMEIDETRILERIAEAFGKSQADFYDAVDELTGLFLFGFISGNQISFLIDPSGMQSGCYGRIGDAFYISSHPQLIADVCGLEMDSFVKELVSYKWYNRVMGPYLPGDLTPFAGVKRIVPNISYTYGAGEVKHFRFYPRKELSVCKTEEEYGKTIKEAADILKNNMHLISKKWEHPQISLTGGIDSNTTFAAANGFYDKFEAFSYLSAPKEAPDAEAAKKLRINLG